MATATEPLLMTVAEYRELPLRENVVQELHWGQLVTLTFPKKRHTKIQSRLLALLQPLAGSKGIVAVELPFRAIPEYDLRAADVAYVSSGRWEATDDDDNLHGAPELVIEVLSPSNTPADMRERAALCLANGAMEFWIVDPRQKRVTVMHRAGSPLVYEPGDSIPLMLFGCDLDVTQIFA
jgi:Uma2 family endonuclease